MQKLVYFFGILLLPLFVAAQSAQTDSLQAIINLNKQDSDHAKALLNLAHIRSKSAPLEAINTIEESISLSKILNEKQIEGSGYLKLGLLWMNLGKKDSALICLKKGEEIVNTLPDHKLLHAQLYNSFGLYYKNQGNFPVALDYYAKYEALASHVEEKDLAGNYLNIANVYYQSGDFKKLQEYTFKALHLFENQRNETGVSFCYNSLGNQYKDLKDFKKAEMYLLKALQVKKKSSDKKSIANTMNGLAVVYNSIGEHDKALELLNSSLQLNKEIGFKDGIIMNYANIGKAYQEMNDFEQSLSFFEKAKLLAEELQNKTKITYINTEIARVHQLKNNQDEEAINNLKQAISQAEESKDVRSQIVGYLYLAEHHAKTNNYKEGLKAYQHYHQLSDSMRGITLQMSMQDLESKYQFEKNENQIALLLKDRQIKAVALERQYAIVTILVISFIAIVIISALLVNRYRLISRSRRQLEIERVRNNIARDLHDDLGSALSSIHINSQLAMHDKAKTQLHLHRINENAARMMESMGDIVWSISPDNDTLDKLIVKMKEFAAEILEPKNINYSFEIAEELEKIMLSVETRKNLYLIFKESINNAAKYSEGSAVVIAIRLQKNNLYLSVRDNGKGFESATIKLGNGLINMAERAKNLRGNLTRQSFPGQGTEIVAELPIV